MKRRLSPKCSLQAWCWRPTLCVRRAARGRASVVQYSAPRPHKDRRTYGQLATDANVLLDDLSAAPTVGLRGVGAPRRPRGFE